MGGDWIVESNLGEQDDNIVGVDYQELLNNARKHRNEALDRLELADATVTQLKKERAELRAKVRELEGEKDGGSSEPSDSSK